jgi:hypothetical protein
MKQSQGLEMLRVTLNECKYFCLCTYHPSLQFKQVSQKQPIYSARVSLNYRVLGLLESDHIYWYWIGGHDEYDDLLKRM